MSKLIDPVVVREQRTRFSTSSSTINQGIVAANALLWFKEFATPTAQITNVLKGRVEVVAGSTPNAAEANIYIDKVLEQVLPDVLERAIQLAQSHFDRASRITKPRKDEDDV